MTDFQQTAFMGYFWSLRLFEMSKKADMNIYSGILPQSITKNQAINFAIFEISRHSETV